MNNSKWQETVLLHAKLHVSCKVNCTVLSPMYHPHHNKHSITFCCTLAVNNWNYIYFANMYMLCFYVLRFWWSSGLMSYTRLRSLSITLSWFFVTLSLIWSSLTLVCSSILAWKSSLEPMCCRKLLLKLIRKKPFHWYLLFINMYSYRQR